MNKPTIETMINTAALTLTSFAVLQLTTTDGNFWKGLILLAVGMSLEFIKYWGRGKKIW